MFTKIKQKVKNLKIRQRMLMVYAIGCFLPLLFVVFFMFYSTKNSLITMHLSDERNMLQDARDEIEASMDLAVELSDKLFFDTSSQRVGLLPISSGTETFYDYRQFGELRETVRKNFGNISSICVYVYPDTVDHVDNKNYRLITDTIREKPWFKKTMERRGLPSWSYLTDLGTGRRSIRLTRIFYNRYHREEGVISISLDPVLTNDLIMDMENYALMTLNQSEVVHANFDITPEEVALLREKYEEWNLERTFRFRDMHCYLSAIEISPRFSEDTYEIMTLRSEVEIASVVQGVAARSMLPLIIAALIMFIAIFTMNSWLSRRIENLGEAMHKVTEKRYDVEDTGIREANDEIFELYNDMKKMVTDMQKLSEDAANERIQREQLYSRQRDVEFKMLTTQINPHFLYNTLENIRMLAMIHNERDIEDISVRLTRLLRSSLEAGGELKPLAWEMDIVDCYIRIQDYRFGDRITSSIEYDQEKAKEVMVMPFILQPFVENAYVHGMEEMEEGGRIEIRARIEDCLKLVIEDNGRGMTEKELKEILSGMNAVDELDRTHIGIVNVNQRIRIRFGEAYGVKFTSTFGKGTKVEIRMPLIHLEKPEN